MVDDLAAATAFFLELGLVLEGEAPVEGPWVDRVVGLDGVRAHGAELVGELGRYQDSHRLCCVRGPDGIIVALSEKLD